MTRSEVAKLLALATANFPSYQERDMRPTLVLWEKMLADLPADLAEAALLKVLATAKFFPTLAHIREAAAELSQPQRLSASEAWALVNDAMTHYGYYRPEEGLASLPDDVRALAKRFGWREMCMVETDQVNTLRAQFTKMWDEHQKREREFAQLPGRLRNMIDEVAQRRALKADRLS